MREERIEKDEHEILFSKKNMAMREHRETKRESGFYFVLLPRHVSSLHWPIYFE